MTLPEHRQQAATLECSFIPVGTGSLLSAQYYSRCYGFHARNCSGYTPGLLLVASVSVGIAMPLIIASMPINYLLVKP